MFCTTIKDYQFNNANLLKIALTHPSAVKNKSKEINYERMEFLGDNILGFVIADLLYHQFINYSEGKLSIMLANLVNSKTISAISKKLDLGNKIILDNGEEKSGGRNRLSNLENVLEAVIAAIYLDSDFSTVKKIVIGWWSEFFNDIDKLLEKDYKSQLQELLQKEYKTLPIYKSEIEESEPHRPVFTTSISFLNKHIFRGQGAKIKEAEQKAAEKMLHFLKR